MELACKMNLSGNERYRPGRTRSGTSTFASAARQGMVQCNLRLHGAIHSRPVRRWPRSPLTYAVDGGLTHQAATVRVLPLTQLEIRISASKKASISRTCTYQLGTTTRTYALSVANTLHRKANVWTREQMIAYASKCKQMFP